MNISAKISLIAVIVGLILIFATPLFPFDELAAFIIAVVAGIIALK